MKEARAKFICLVAALLFALCAHAAAAQTATAKAEDKVLLSVGGEVPKPLGLTAGDLSKLPRRSIKAKDHDGKEYTFEGVELVEVLRLAGVGFGEHLRGKAVANYLLVEASDGYKAVFALPEVDPEYSERVVLLADKRDGAALAPAEGPFRIIVEGEKRHARWVRQVTKLTIRKSD
ncbi:MAG TPA: molybdopterin-dependent oxidoreductase [Pyrinomonadaceae bacterium]|nr:molybdopterin-dependent oxidoreductase [Pyrinomonadaceae bacterium]